MPPGTYVPRAGRSVRPADLDRSRRAAVGAPPAPRASLVRRFETPLLVVTALVLAFVIKTFLVQAFFIPSGSMLETLQIGDRVLVEKVTDRFREPRRGEILVFRRPGIERRTGVGAVVRDFLQGFGLVEPDADIDLIKRLIAVGGETVEVRDGVVRVDGVALREPYLDAPTEEYGPLEVPEGHLFFLGDNRGNSDDSRFSLGTVPRSEVVGRAVVIIWPPRNARLLVPPETRAAAGDTGAGADREDLGGLIDAPAGAWLPWLPDASASIFALPPHVPVTALRRTVPRGRRTTPHLRTLGTGCLHEPHRPRRRRAPP